MVTRIALATALIGLAAFAVWHPAPHPAIEATAASPLPLAPPPRYRHRRDAGSEELVVYVAGAVHKPGLYTLHAGDRNARAVALAGGLTASADAAAVNLAARVADGDEIAVPAIGESVRSVSATHRRSRRHAAALQAGANVDINRADASELAAVPGIGHAIAQRIVDLREREGAFTSLDELLDVAGMTQSRLERARAYLQTP